VTAPQFAQSPARSGAAGVLWKLVHDDLPALEKVCHEELDARGTKIYRKGAAAATW
jgi:hypothetical protein